MKEMGVDLPTLAMLSLVGVGGFRLHHQTALYLPGEIWAIDRDVLTLPDVLIEDYECNAASVLKDSFDVLWSTSLRVGSNKSPPLIISSLASCKALYFDTKSILFINVAVRKISITLQFFKLTRIQGLKVKRVFLRKAEEDLLLNAITVILYNCNSLPGDCKDRFKGSPI